MAMTAAVGIASPALSATIDLETSFIDGKRVSFITIEGELEYGDEARFADLAIGAPAGMVVLASPGGNLHAGIEIGKAIRLKGFVTAAFAGNPCASACALAWLGGRTRFMSADFAVGFHAVYLTNDPSRRADSVGNALVGAYLNQLGLPPQAIAYITEAQPQGMRWLSFEDAQSVGIEVVGLDPTDESRETADAGLPAASDDWASYGEWIQIYSRQSLAEAIDLARRFRREFPGTLVFRYDNGWYVVAIGPYDFGKARPERDRLVRLKRIPSDSLVNRGSRFVELVWGASPDRPSVGALPTPEALALDAANEFFQTWSGTTVQAIGFLNRTYAPQVTYFGRKIPKGEVMKEKSAFVERWPQRSYTVRPGASVRCTPAGLCVVDGTVDWRAYSSARNTTSVGTASFSLSFQLRGSSYSLVAESSSVLARETRKGR